MEKKSLSCINCMIKVKIGKRVRSSEETRGQVLRVLFTYVMAQCERNTRSTILKRVNRALGTSN